MVSAPTDLVALVNNKDVTITWQDNANNENGFSLERSQGGAYQVIRNLAANTQTYTDKELQAGTYTYRVRAWDATNYSDYSNTAQAVIEEEVNPPGVVENCNGCRVYDTNSEETVREDQGKEKAVDGDLNTYWHTNWYDDNSSHPHFIAIDSSAIWSVFPIQEGRPGLRVWSKITFYSAGMDQAGSSWLREHSKNQP